MRIFIKGGVWKNTEDEILKAAVMKYGKNQWDRISSLLVRKSAKQCKARWLEWLDPSIKKTSWSREEEEKLLHLAKIMPMQWRTIAPIVGRTAAQCLQKYEQLLDRAQGRDDLDAADDPRKLRTGEIDPSPETRPAKPDPVNMDEDELDMLQEARARLANTLGKKAKRMAREAQLEEARRLIMLQKRRELKAAGVTATGFKRKKMAAHEVDPSVEVPFERPAPAGFFAVPASETPAVNYSKFIGKNRDDLDGKHRHAKEEEARKTDAKKQKTLEETNLPQALANKAKAAASTRKRAPMALPKPQMTDDELRQVVEMGEGADALAASEGGGVTAGLLPSYAAATPAGLQRMRTPARTPMTSAEGLMREAQNLIALNSSASALIGGANTPLHNPDFGGAAPRSTIAATPNIHAAALASSSGSARAVQLVDPAIKDKALLSHLRSKLAALPKPQNAEIEVSLPALPAESGGAGGGAQRVADQSELAEERAAAAAAAAAAAERLQSSAKRRGLPLPSGAVAVPASGLAGAAAALIDAELAAMLAADARGGAQAADVAERELAAARRLIETEAGALEAERGEVSADAVAAAAAKTKASGGRGKARLAAVKKQVAAARASLLSESKRAAKVEAKVSVLVQGFQRRAEALRAEIAALAAQAGEDAHRLECFEALRGRESVAIAQRVEAAQREVAAQRERNVVLQARWQAAQKAATA